MTTLKTILLKAATLLEREGINDATLDARLLIGHALGYDRAELIAHHDKEMNAAQQAEIEALIMRRARREPVARILGTREFWGLPFGLNEETLEPRPDSETLIETALKRVKENKPKRILDLGTGTGCLLLALLHEWKGATGLGIDQSEKAVQQATLNAANLQLHERAVFQQGNWLDGLNEKFDLIISNPPYITTKEMEQLEPEVRVFDPVKALEGGKDGLDPYKYLIPRLPAFLNKDGLVLFEVGKGQASAVAALMEKTGFADIQAAKDLGGVERCLSGLAL